MPFVNIHIVEGVKDQAKSRIAKSVAKTISEETGIPEKSIWIAFDDVRPEEWFVGDSSVADIRKGAKS